MKMFRCGFRKGAIFGKRHVLFYKKMSRSGSLEMKGLSKIMSPNRFEAPHAIIDDNSVIVIQSFYS